MEALVCVSAAALTIYDMSKMFSQDIEIERIFYWRKRAAKAAIIYGISAGLRKQTDGSRNHIGHNVTSHKVTSKNKTCRGGRLAARVKNSDQFCSNFICFDNFAIFFRFGILISQATNGIS